MKTKKSLIGIKEIFGIIFLVLVVGLIFSFDYVVSYFNSANSQVEESRKASKEISDLLIQIDQISFDTSVLKSSYFQGLVNIPSFPIDESSSSFGKKNPFVKRV